MHGKKPEKKHEFECGFVVRKELRHIVFKITVVNDSLNTIFYKEIFFSSSKRLTAPCFWVHERQISLKGNFYNVTTRLGMPSTQSSKKYTTSYLPLRPKSSTEILIRPTVGQFSLCDNTNCKGTIRLYHLWSSTSIKPSGSSQTDPRLIKLISDRRKARFEHNRCSHI